MVNRALTRLYPDFNSFYIIFFERSRKSSRYDTVPDGTMVAFDSDIAEKGRGNTDKINNTAVIMTTKVPADLILIS